MSDRKPFDPDVRAFLDEAAVNAPDLTKLSDSERTGAARTQLRDALHSRETIPGLPNDVGTRDLHVSNDRHARLYRPQTAPGAIRPLLVYLHGGGWVAGSLETHDPFCRLFAYAANVPLLAIDYRQPPQYRFPAALEDTLAAFHWAAEHANELGVHPAYIALGGDSAGGNLAAVATNILVATPHAPQPRAQLLLYPVTDHPSANHPSYEENATGVGLTAEGMRWYWRQYAPDVDPDDPAISPLRLDPLPALPPTLIATAEYDVLRDEGRAYADKLRGAGIPTTHFHAPDMPHNFPISPAMVNRFPQCETALNQIAGWLRATLHTPLPASSAARAALNR